jgi:CRP-like cAMP-binding protein
VSLLADLGQAQLERLAQDAAPRSLSAGELLLREGEPADDLYVLVEGSCQALLSGRVVNVVHAPDVLGEIGVLHRRPRTATVRARTDCRLLRLSGQEFAEAVLARPLATSLLESVDARLARTGHRRAGS